VAAERPERNEPVNILAEKEKKMMATFLHQMNGLLVGDVSSVVKAEWWVGWPVAPPLGWKRYEQFSRLSPFN
jgi:hypothetical protein